MAGGQDKYPETRESSATQQTGVTAPRRGAMRLSAGGKCKRRCCALYHEKEELHARRARNCAAASAVGRRCAAERCLWRRRLWRSRRGLPSDRVRACRDCRAPPVTNVSVSEIPRSKELVLTMYLAITRAAYVAISPLVGCRGSPPLARSTVICRLYGNELSSNLSSFARGQVQACRMNDIERAGVPGSGMTLSVPS